MHIFSFFNQNEKRRANYWICHIDITELLFVEDWLSGGKISLLWFVGRDHLHVFPDTDCWLFTFRGWAPLKWFHNKDVIYHMEVIFKCNK